MDNKQDDNKDDVINEMMSEEGEGDAMTESFAEGYDGPFTQPYPEDGPFTQPYPEASTESPTKDNEEYTESDDERDSAIVFSEMSESERVLPLPQYAKLFYQRFDELRKNRKLNQGNDGSEVGAVGGQQRQQMVSEAVGDETAEPMPPEQGENDDDSGKKDGDGAQDKHEFKGVWRDTQVPRQDLAIDEDGILPLEGEDDVFDKEAENKRAANDSGAGPSNAIGGRNNEDEGAVGGQEPQVNAQNNAGNNQPDQRNFINWGQLVYGQQLPRHPRNYFDSSDEEEKFNEHKCKFCSAQYKNERSKRIHERSYCYAPGGPRNRSTANTNVQPSSSFAIPKEADKDKKQADETCEKKDEEGDGDIGSPDIIIPETDLEDEGDDDKDSGEYYLDENKK